MFQPESLPGPVRWPLHTEPGQPLPCAPLLSCPRSEDKETKTEPREVPLSLPVPSLGLSLGWTHLILFLKPFGFPKPWIFTTVLKLVFQAVMCLSIRARRLHRFLFGCFGLVVVVFCLCEQGNHSEAGATPFFCVWILPTVIEHVSGTGLVAGFPLCS